MIQTQISVLCSPVLASDPWSHVALLLPQGVNTDTIRGQEGIKLTFYSSRTKYRLLAWESHHGLQYPNRKTCAWTACTPCQGRSRNSRKPTLLSFRRFKWVCFLLKKMRETERLYSGSMYTNLRKIKLDQHDISTCSGNTILQYIIILQQLPPHL